MRTHNRLFLIFILLLALAAAYVSWPGNPGIHVGLGSRRIDARLDTHLGLDLQGGIAVLLEADVPPEQEVTGEDMAAVKTIVDNRVNSLGVAEPLIQISGNNRLVVELPGIENPEEAIDTLKGTGLLEFIDASGFCPGGYQVFATCRDIVGRTVQTTFGHSGQLWTDLEQTVPPAAGALAEEGQLEGYVFPTVITGRHLQSATVGFDNFNSPAIDFNLTPEGSRLFEEYTQRNVGQILAIALDKQVISAPAIRSAISDRGQITGDFTPDEARNLVIQLRYGSLPIPLKIVQIRSVGPTLGEESVHKSLIAGYVGLAMVVVFMLLYYRLPGLLADLALFVYALVVFALFKLIPVTLTLPAIAAFILSVGMAVDANILIFERMKEELRAGRSLGLAMDLGFSRAWPSIRDSNISTLITSAILFWFGSQFGASLVKGFALTLAIGVLVSMFSAILVTRSFLYSIFRLDAARNPRLFGV